MYVKYPGIAVYNFPKIAEIPNFSLKCNSEKEFGSTKKNSSNKFFLKQNTMNLIVFIFIRLVKKKLVKPVIAFFS